MLAVKTNPKFKGNGATQVPSTEYRKNHPHVEGIKKDARP